MTVVVSGANGFTGRFVCLELLRRQQTFIALLRPGSDTSWMDANKISVRFADLNCTEQLAEQLNGCHALLNVASIGFGAAPSILEACRSVAVRRVVFVSTTAIFTQLNAGSKVVRKAAEAAIIASTLETTIIRPTMIYGTPDDRNMIRLIRWLDRWPVIPVFGNGRSLQQPVHVQDVAWAIVQALETSATINRQINISGASPLSYNELIRIAAEALGRSIHPIHIPAKLIVAALQVIERFGFTLPIKAEQVLRLNEDKAFSHAEAAEAFGYSPMAFEQGIRQEVALLRSGADGLSV